MEYVFVLEDEEIHRRAISKALKTIDPLLKTKFFKDLEDFYKWLKIAMSTQDRVLDSAVDDLTPDKVRLLISKAEFISPANMGILGKARELLIHRGLCSNEEPVGFLMTAFDDPEFKFEHYKNPLLLNLVFKPFDEIILTQHLSSALAGFNRPTESTLSSQKTSATAEMLKVIEVMAVSDVGFTSKSKKNYQVGLLSKYYSGIFAVPGSRSVHARLSSAVENGPEDFELEYRFFASELAQIANLRKLVRAKDKSKPMDRGPQGGVSTPNPAFAIIEPREAEFNVLAGTIRRRFGGAQIFRYLNRKEFELELNYANNSGKSLLSDLASVEISKDYVIEKAIPSDLTLFGKPVIGFDLTTVMDRSRLNQFGIWKMGPGKEHLALLKTENIYSVVKFVKSGNQMAMINPAPQEKVDFLKSKRELPNELHFVIVCADVDPQNLSGWEALKTLYATEVAGPPIMHLLANRAYNDDDKKRLEPVFEDVFFAPLDRAYFLLKLIYSRFAMTVLEDKLYVTEKNISEKVYAAARVQIEEISEAGIGFRYPGIVDKGSFREFVLERPNDAAAPVLTGICYACDEIEERDKTKESFSNVYFVFFGVRDHELKFIRLWIRENYVHTKDKGN